MCGEVKVYKKRNTAYVGFNPKRKVVSGCFASNVFSRTVFLSTKVSFHSTKLFLKGVEHLAYEYAKGGACLALVARREKRLEAVAVMAQRLGSPDVIVESGNISKVEDCKRFIDAALNHFEHNLPGFCLLHPFRNSAPEKEQREITAVASMAQRCPVPRASIYCASKGAVVSFYKTLRTEVGSNIEITIVTPRLVDSEMTRGESKSKFLASILSYIFSENVAEKVVIIAGASSGIGEHLAYEYARRGACLALAARRKNSLREVGERALLLGSPDVVVVPSDVSKVEDCKRLIDETISHFGRLDHLVNDAGVTPLCMFEEPTEITKMAPVMDINFWGYVYTTRFAIPHLRRSRGKIIVIGSSASWLYAPRLSFYAASKAAVISFFETLRVELGSDIGITIVNPGLIESEMTKGKFLNKDGRMVVDQELRDVSTALNLCLTFSLSNVELSIVPVERVERGAKAIVDSACRGENYLTEPSWFRTTFFWRVFCPEILDWLNRVFLIPPPGAPPTEALSKKILDLTGLKKYIYPPSLLSPKIKVG
ncbi:hypothetical protein RHSIM_Rhsim08G0192400 [Rhododendron simsii]|uniref:Uncharacterized protein n=1 Tax=Rhododendron simsii TaxID=118357 RepID=A0A834LDT7_RHOSS|nr:hypothetical protein RHSIM_Rhsim08G0192400 [Rhododendron simsii]